MEIIKVLALTDQFYVHILQQSTSRVNQRLAKAMVSEMSL